MMLAMWWPRLLSVLLLVVATVVAAPAAAAEDVLVRSDPAAGEHLPGAPAEVRLEFAEGYVVEEVAVVDAEGADRAGDVAVEEGGKVTVALDPEPAAGAYEVRWRLRAEDGEQVSGVVPFTVAPTLPMPRLARPDPAALELVDSTRPGAPPWVRTAVVSALGVVVSLVVLPRIRRWRTRQLRAADPVEQALRASGAMELRSVDDPRAGHQADRHTS